MHEPGWSRRSAWNGFSITHRGQSGGGEWIHPHPTSGCSFARALASAGVGDGWRSDMFCPSCFLRQVKSVVVPQRRIEDERFLRKWRRPLKHA